MVQMVIPDRAEGSLWFGPIQSTMGLSMTARVYVTPKSTVLDPQGQTIRAALNAHGHTAVSDVRQGKYFEIRLAESLEPASARAEIDEIAREVLSNPVIEEYRVEILP